MIYHIPRCRDERMCAVPYLAELISGIPETFENTDFQSYEMAYCLAYWYYIFGKEAEALTVCKTLGQFPISENDYCRPWIGFVLALQIRILRFRSDKSEIAKLLARIIEAGTNIEFHSTGGLKDAENHILLSSSYPNTDLPLMARKSLAAVLCLCIEVLGARGENVDVFEKRFDENMVELRTLLGIKDAHG